MAQSALTKALEQAGESLGGFLPRLVGALVLLVVGVLLARLLARLVTRSLSAVGLDDLAERWGVHGVLGQAGLPASLSRVLGIAVRIGLTLVVIFAALSLLGLQFLSESLNQAILVLPKLLIGAALILAGVVLGGLARQRVDRLAYQLDFPVPLGLFAQISVIAVFVITAASQIAISTLVLMVLVGIVLAAAAGTLTLAFGLGGREVARTLGAGRYVRGAFEVGQTVSVGEVRGRITAIEGVATVLDAGAGQSVRVPNHLMLESVVTIHEGDGAPEPGE